MDDQETQSVTYQLSSLERPDWLIKAGLDKGVNHDRVNLRWVLVAGSKIRFRLKTPALNAQVRLNLLSDNSKNEKHSEVKEQWGELIANVASVPFLTTPYMDKAGEPVEVEVEFVGSKKLLPIYVEGMPDELFFRVGTLSRLNTRCFLLPMQMY